MRSLGSSLVAATVMVLLSSCVFAPPVPTPSSPEPTAAASPSSPAASPAPPAPACASEWGVDVQSAPGMRQAPVVGLRVGQHECYERIVIDIQGEAPGYEVSYVPAVLADGSGEVVDLRGDGFLRVVILAPAYDESGASTYDPPDRSELADVSSFTAAQQIALAGSFEGVTTFGVGVDEERPFRVFMLAGPGTGSRIVVDLALI